jgi:hypothetical protein
MRPRIACVLAVVVTAVAACADRAGDAVPAGPGWAVAGPSGVDAAVLDAWRDFPVDRVPRPIVLLGEVARVEGFTTNEAKEAAGQAHYEYTGALPDGPATATVALPDGPARLRLVDAASALAALRTPAEPVPPAMAVPPLRITAIELGTAEFLTDRGRLALPAWLFHVVAGLGPIAWPAVEPAAFWRLGELGYPTAGSGNTISADGMTLTVTQGAAPTDACPGEPLLAYDPVLVERATAVAVGLHSRVVSPPSGPPRQDCARDLVFRTQPYPYRLTTPLGNRVVVDSQGNPVPVVNA